MTEPIERALAEWLREGPEHGPVDGLERTLAAARRTPQRPGWTFPERWLPMQLTLQRPMVPRAVVYLAVLALVIAALVVAALILPGQSLPAPLGTVNGVIVYDVDGQLYLADADGSDPRPLSQPTALAYSPAFSPDGSRMAYLAAKAGGLQVFVARADGTEPRQISTMPSGGNTKFAPVWAPDGASLVYAAIDGDIHRVALDGSFDESIGAGWSPTWSPDGQWIAYRRDGSPEAHLVIVRPDGSDRKELAAGPANTDAFATMRWTADSSRIVFHRAGVWTVDLEGSEQQLAAEGGYPTVSPDGRWVAYLREIRIGVEELNLVDLETMATRTISQTAGCLAVWAPDSTAVITFANGCFTDLQLIPIDNPAAAVILDLPKNTGGFPAWQGLAH